MAGTGSSVISIPSSEINISFVLKDSFLNSIGAAPGLKCNRKMRFHWCSDCPASSGKILWKLIENYEGHGCGILKSNLHEEAKYIRKHIKYNSRPVLDTTECDARMTTSTQCRFAQEQKKPCILNCFLVCILNTCTLSKTLFSHGKRKELLKPPQK
jgi:hypothetical protein